MTDEKAPRYWYFTPEGWPVQRVMSRGWQSADLDKCGPTTSDIEYSSGDYPDMELWGDGVIVFADEDADDWLLHHCRLVEVYEDYSPWEWSKYEYNAEAGGQVEQKPPVEPWPQDLIDACLRVTSLHGVRTSYNEMLRWLPIRFKTDTFGVVMDRFLLGPTNAEIERVEAMVTAHRAAHPDITKLEEPDAQV